MITMTRKHVVLAIFIFLFIVLSNYKLRPTTLNPALPEIMSVGLMEHQADPWASINYVLGAPTQKFRDNLRNDTSYLTAWTDGGFTNEFISYVHLIYLANLAGRVPIIPPFAPFHHMDSSAGVLSFGDVFDLSPLRSVLRMPVLEWRDVKTPVASSQAEPLGCWSTWATSGSESEPRRAGNLVNYLNLDVSYTAVPRSTRRLLNKEGEGDWFLLFWSLAVLVYPTSPPPPAVPAQYASWTGSVLPPDHQLTCFDLLYFTSASREDFEWQYDWCPPWRFVGTHLRFTNSMQELAQGYVRRALGLTTKDLTPYIAVHVRRGDFMGMCSAEAVALEACYPPLSAFVRRVSEVQHEIYTKKEIWIPDHHVILTSDEQDPVFWQQVRDQGWKTIDHEAERTVKLYGEWYTVVLDTIVQGLALGFVGTDQSTVSIVSAKRVEDWYGGAWRMVRWGRLGADDH